MYFVLNYEINISSSCNKLRSEDILIRYLILEEINISFISNLLYLISLNSPKADNSYVMRSIPYDIKIQIFRSYLEGLSIPQISILYNVSVGTVFSIIKEEIKKDELFQFFREIAKTIKKNNLSVYDLIRAIYLNSKIVKLGLSSELFEKFLDLADTKSFRLDMNLDEFLNKITDIIDFEKSTQTQIHDIHPFIEKEKNQLDALRREKEMIEKEIDNSSGNIGLLKSWILEYIQQKPLFLMYKEDKEAFFKPLDLATKRNIK